MKATFETITGSTLASITGGKTTSAQDQQLTQMLTDISSSIKDAVAAKNKGTDPSQLMMMMMMMGGMGGGGGGAAAAAPPPPADVQAPPGSVVRVNVR